jgi:uncharacterized protein YjeT (DUF2065 family)
MFQTIEQLTHDMKDQTDRRLRWVGGPLLALAVIVGVALILI